MSWSLISVKRESSELKRSKSSIYIAKKSCWSCEKNTLWSSSRRSKLYFLRKSARVWYQTRGACFNPYKALRKRQTSLELSTNKCGCSTYIISSRNPYRKAVTIFICQILYSCFTLISNRNMYKIGLTAAANVATKSMPSFCLKQWTTYLALYFRMWLLQFFFNLKHHRSVMNYWFSGSRVSSQVSSSFKKLYSAYIAFFYLGQSKKRMAYLRVWNSSSRLLPLLASSIFRVCIMWICDWHIRVLINQAKLEAISLMSRFWYGCPEVLETLLYILVEL